MLTAVFCHLNDDYSGSPRVLLRSIRALSGQISSPMLLVSTNGSGLLAQAGIRMTRYWYRKPQRKPLRIIAYAASQACLLWKLTRLPLTRGALIYVNTNLPVAAAVYGKITGRSVVFHSHELPRSALEAVLTRIVLRMSSKVLCVSDFHRKELAQLSPRQDFHLLPNPLDPTFQAAADRVSKLTRASGKFLVVLVSSCTAQKGVAEFFNLASTLVHHHSIRFLFATPDELSPACSMPTNVDVIRNADLVGVYESADVLVNLSRTDLVRETFGLTILEAMAFGVPTIVPPVGGPSELVRHGVEGFHVDSRDRESLIKHIIRMSTDQGLWEELSKNAKRRALEYTCEAFDERLRFLVNERS